MLQDFVLFFVERERSRLDVAPQMIEQTLFELSKGWRMASINDSKLTLDGSRPQRRFDVQRFLSISSSETLLNDNPITHQARPPDFPTAINAHGKSVDKTVDSARRFCKNETRRYRQKTAILLGFVGLDVRLLGQVSRILSLVRLPIPPLSHIHFHSSLDAVRGQLQRRVPKGSFKQL
ncbi:MAG: hypothetical protein WA718_03875 [Terriglobales bacterium]